MHFQDLWELELRTMLCFSEPLKIRAWSQVKSQTGCCWSADPSIFVDRYDFTVNRWILRLMIIFTREGLSLLVSNLPWHAFFSWDLVNNFYMALYGFIMFYIAYVRSNNFWIGQSSNTSSLMFIPDIIIMLFSQTFDCYVMKHWSHSHQLNLWLLLDLLSLMDQLISMERFTNFSNSKKFITLPPYTSI